MSRFFRHCHRQDTKTPDNQNNQKSACRLPEPPNQIDFRVDESDPGSPAIAERNVMTNNDTRLRESGDDAVNQQRYRCPKSMHLRISQDFERIYADGERIGDAHLLIFATSNCLKVARLGLSISRKHGSAVQRNLKRRRIREAFRRLQHELPQSYDLIVVPRQRDDSTMQDFRNSLRTLIRKLAKRIMAAESDVAAGPADDSGGDP